MLEALLAILIIVAVLAVTIPTIYGFFIGAPIVFSPKKAALEALQSINVQPGENFYDLGAGSGRAMIIAGKKFGLDVVGFEMSPILFCLAELNLFSHGIKNFRLHLKNFYNQNLSGADIIFCFLTPPAMAKLKPKFEKELRRGSRIISYAFSIAGWEPHMVLQKSYPGKVFIYIKD